jgi:hypothetical protein
MRARWVIVIVAVCLVVTLAATAYAAGRTATPDTSQLPDVPPGLAALLGLALGGGLPFVRDYLRHRRLGKERVQDALLAERVEAYKRIMQELNHIRRQVGLLQIEGIEGLRSPKKLKISPEFFTDDGKSDGEMQARAVEARRLHDQLRGLPGMMNSYLVVCGPQVLKDFFKAWGDFYSWHVLIQGRDDSQMEAEYPGCTSEIQAAFDRLTLDTQASIAADWGVRGFAAPEPGELRMAYEQGVENAGKIRNRLAKQKDAEER